jgi:hypothetical protein
VKGIQVGINYHEKHQYIAYAGVDRRATIDAALAHLPAEEAASVRKKLGPVIEGGRVDPVESTLGGASLFRYSRPDYGVDLFICEIEILK